MFQSKTKYTQGNHFLQHQPWRLRIPYNKAIESYGDKTAQNKYSPQVKKKRLAGF